MQNEETKRGPGRPRGALNINPEKKAGRTVPTYLNREGVALFEKLRGRNEKPGDLFFRALKALALQDENAP